MSIQPVEARPSPEADENVVIGYPPSRAAARPLVLGPGARLRSGSVLYDGSEIGANLQTGHNVTIREECRIGNDVSIWTNTVVDYGCRIGDRVKIHSNCYVAQYSVIDADAFLAPGVVFANDLYPGYEASADVMGGPHVGSGAQVGVNTTVLPYVEIGAGAIIGAGSVVTKDIPARAIAYGSPAVVAGSLDDLGDVDARVRARGQSLVFPVAGVMIPRTPMDLVKRAMDVVLASILLVALAPLLIAIALVVRVTSRGPALYRQVRLGRGKRPFTMLKFRSIREACDDRIHRDYVTQLLTNTESQTGERETVYKLVDDPRVTRVGRVLRRSSIDELPQLVNVVRGEMSLVGPRPMLDWEVELLAPEYDARFEVAPGITGLWQVTGRNRLTMREAIDLDVEYVRARTISLDVRILVMTIPAVAGSALTGKDAR